MIKQFIKITQLVSDRAEILDQNLFLLRQVDDLGREALSHLVSRETESPRCQGDFPGFLVLVKEIVGGRTHVF
jgi:hypothetical protein